MGSWKLISFTSAVILKYLPKQVGEQISEGELIFQKTQDIGSLLDFPINETLLFPNICQIPLKCEFLEINQFYLRSDSQIFAEISRGTNI